MFEIKCLLAFIALFFNVAHSWDFAITIGDQIEFYKNGTKTNAEGVRFRDLTALAYDAVHNMLLFVDKQNDNASIFSYHLATKQYQPLVRRRSYENIQGLAFDPIQKKLFWTDTNERSIYWISLKPGSKNDIYGNLLIKMDNEIPRAIAVDSCRQYIYWTNTNITKPTIERARLDGTEREVVIDTKLYMPISIVVDQQTKRLYWADDKEGIHFSIESSDLNGKDRQTILEGTYHQPNSLTVSKDYLYWVDWGFKSVWRLPKKLQKDVEPSQITKFSTESPFGIVANYKTEEQTNGSTECIKLKQLSDTKTALNDTFNIPRDMGLFCLHGVKMNGKLACKCSQGYTGERCEISLCQNFCLDGLCKIDSNGQPQCKCTPGFTGSRCQNNLCDTYCQNDGICSLINNKPVCQCSSEFEGLKCEKRKDIELFEGHCNCTNKTEQNAQLLEAKAAQEGTFVEQSCTNDGWDTIRDPIIMVLGTLTGLMAIACAVMISKILQLKKRPRIKKRIIVNKNVTPLTARPEQCEITIENCCNMNICETPCFEPRTTIRPSLLEAKQGKEEKKNLIANMEYPDDY